MDSVLLSRVASRFQAGEQAGRKPEDRLRALVAIELRKEGFAIQAGSPEWQPSEGMPLWPNDGAYKLGGFDVSGWPVASPDGSPHLVIETKWSNKGSIDALDEAPWDLFKLAHASATIPVKDALLVYAATKRAWDKPPRFIQFFDGSSIDTRRVIEEHRNVWKWLLSSSSKARPRALPPTIQTQDAGRADFVFADRQWAIRAARVTSVEPRDRWYPLNAEGWPAISAG